jgi:hypothetical protein
MHITNNTGISLPLAVWLIDDNYDYVNEPNYISATGLMKPLRHIILPRRVTERTAPDVTDFISRALGHSLHDSIEKAWLKNSKRNLALLGFPESVQERILINPTPEELNQKENAIPIYLEKRNVRSLGKYRIGGKFDMVADGIVNDYKSTTAFTWMHGTRDDKHALQGSIYRWLNPDKVTEDFIRINYIFTDWQKFSAKSNPAYPQQRVQHKDIPLLSIAETEQWMRNKLALVDKYMDADEADIPECTDAELWRSDPVYKYFSDPTKTSGRSSKNFDDAASARVYMVEKGGKGIVKAVPGEVKRCGYCDAFSVCTQKDRYQTND